MDPKGVQIAHWNPKRQMFKGRIGRFISRRVPISNFNNFGDLLGPMVVNQILALHGIAGKKPLNFEEVGDAPKLLSVGSVLHFANDGDTVWGAGRNGKKDENAHRFRSLDVRMVRGPKTRAFLATMGIDAPDVYGDPALLFPDLFKDHMVGWKKGRGGVSILPNLNEFPVHASEGRVINPRSNVWSVLRTIYESEIVVASSLHGFILAEAFGVKARLLRSNAESDFKYEDYLEGTGRREPCMYATIQEALSAPDHPAPTIASAKMRNAFPLDIFQM